VVVMYDLSKEAVAYKRGYVSKGNTVTSLPRLTHLKSSNRLVIILDLSGRGDDLAPTVVPVNPLQGASDSIYIIDLDTKSGFGVVREKPYQIFEHPECYMLDIKLLETKSAKLLSIGCSTTVAVINLETYAAALSPDESMLEKPVAIDTPPGDFISGANNDPAASASNVDVLSQALMNACGDVVQLEIEGSRPSPSFKYGFCPKGGRGLLIRSSSDGTTQSIGNDSPLGVPLCPPNFGEKKRCCSTSCPSANTPRLSTCGRVFLDYSGSYLVIIVMQYVWSVTPDDKDCYGTSSVTWTASGEASASVYSVDWTSLTIEPVGPLFFVRPLYSPYSGLGTSTTPLSVHVGRGKDRGDGSDHLVIRTLRGLIVYLIKDIQNESVHHAGKLSQVIIPDVKVDGDFELASYTPAVTNYINGSTNIELVHLAPAVVTPEKAPSSILTFQNSEVLRVNLVPLTIETNQTRVSELTTVVGSTYSILWFIFGTVGTFTTFLSWVFRSRCSCQVEAKESDSTSFVNPIMDRAGVEIGSLRPFSGTSTPVYFSTIDPKSPRSRKG
jgi:hypothetical protein